MINRILSTLLIAVFAVQPVVARKPVTISAKDIKNIVGCWNAKLDYSGTIVRKPYTTHALVAGSQLGNANTFRLVYSYTANAADNTADTISISKDGRKLNGATIQSKRCTKGGAIEITTEAAGFDHDQNQKVLVRQLYTIGKRTYTYKKQVKLQGQTEWLDRQLFTYTRMQCSSKRNNANADGSDPEVNR
jgi:hypothetical protein